MFKYFDSDLSPRLQLPAHFLLSFHFLCLVLADLFVVPFNIQQIDTVEIVCIQFSKYKYEPKMAFSAYYVTAFARTIQWPLSHKCVCSH